MTIITSHPTYKNAPKEYNWIARIEEFKDDPLHGHGETENDAVLSLLKNAVYDEGDGSAQEEVIELAYQQWKAAQSIRLRFGELSNDEVKLVRAAIEWTGSRVKVKPLEFGEKTNYGEIKGHKNTSGWSMETGHYKISHFEGSELPYLVEYRMRNISKGKLIKTEAAALATANTHHDKAVRSQIKEPTP